MMMVWAALLVFVGFAGGVIVTASYGAIVARAAKVDSVLLVSEVKSAIKATEGRVSGWLREVRDSVHQRIDSAKSETVGVIAAAANATATAVNTAAQDTSGEVKKL